MSKLQLGITGALAVAGSAGWVMQAQSNAGLRQEIAGLRLETQAVVAALRAEGAELDRLGDEAAALQVRRRELARAEAARSASASAHDVSKVDRAPRPRFQARPKYPAALRAAGIAGEVLVDFVVDANGEVRNPVANVSKLAGKEFSFAKASAGVVALSKFEVVGASSATTTVNGVPTEDAARLLSAAAVEAVGQWKFDAGQKGGRMVNTRLQVPIVFSLNNGRPQPAGGAKP